MTQGSFFPEPPSESAQAQKLVAYWVEQFVEANGYAPPSRARGRMGQMVAQLREDGIPDDVIQRALQLAVIRGRGASSMPELVLACSKSTSRADEWVNRHGYPTGCRMVRGEVGVSYIQHPLGLEPPPRWWKHSRPTRQEIERELDKGDNA